MNERCPTCVYFESLDDGHTHGLCRRNPPVVIPRVESSTSVPVALLTKAHTSFPYVRKSDWCGDHEKR